MIYPERMERVVIAGPKERLKVTIETLHDLNVLHIIEHRKDELDIGSPLPGSAQLSEQLVKVRSAMHVLGIERKDEDPDRALSGDIGAEIARITEAANKNEAERKQLQERVARLRTATGPGVERDREAVLRSLEAVKAARERLRDQEAPFLYAAERFLTTESKKAQTPLRFAVSKSAFLINGWVPKDDLHRLKTSLEKATAGEIHIETHGEAEGAPIKLRNNSVVSPFEMVLKLYTLPKYNEIDPTLFLFLSFPFFFGIILGDIGYGLVLLAGALAMKRFWRSVEAQAFANILLLSAISTIVFGVVFGEFFGFMKLGSLELPYLIHRKKDIMTLLLVCIGIGVLHITLALVTGFVQEARHHGGWKAFCAKASWLLLLIAAGMVAADAFLGTPLATPGYVLGGIAIALIIIGEGARGIIELPAIFSNIASYARLMAVGVASAGLAIVVNELATTLFATGNVLNILLGVFVIVIGHIINIALGILGSFIHGLRLNYVEFFGKFYEGGGRPYQPFGKEER